MPGTELTNAQVERDMSEDAKTLEQQLAGKYLTFHLGEEVFGLEILKVQEIIGIERVTSVPGTPDHVRGVINLRGKVIPIIELRLKFALEHTEDTDRTCIIVVQVMRGDEQLVVGVIVDAVSEVLEIASKDIEPAPELGDEGKSYLLGIGKVDKAVIMLLDIDMVVSGSDMVMLGKISQ